MTGIEASAPTTRSTPMRPRWRRPSTRGGVAGLVVLLVVATFLAVQFGRQVYANWESGQRVAQLEAQIAAIDEENDLLAEELGYLRSEGFVSAEARRLANLGAEGDQVLIIPSGAEAPLPEELAAANAPKPLLEQWWAVFFGPGSGR
jgi:cell division protein FtsB